MGAGRGFWLSENEELEISLASSHVRKVFESPERFGFTAERLEAWYRETAEVPGREGYARDRIVIEATTRGWVRVRHYPRGGEYWSIQFDRWKDRRHLVLSWLDRAVGHGIVHPDAVVRLTAFGEGIFVERRANEILAAGEELTDDALLQTLKLISGGNPSAPGDHRITDTARDGGDSPHTGGIHENDTRVLQKAGPLVQRRPR